MIIETKITKIIEGKTHSPLTKALLRVLSEGYRMGVSMRHFAYDRFLTSVKLPIPVISIGNIVAGGTGKTPVVRYLAELVSKEAKIAILSRGYRRKGKGTLLVKDGVPAIYCGDEPFWLAKKLPDAEVIVGTNRIHSAQVALSLSSTLIFLDDGMQYLRLKRDLEIGVMHADDLFGKGFYLPRGYLRDHPARLAQTDLIIVNGVVDEIQFKEIETRIRRYSSSPITAMALKVENQTELASKKVAAFCAIATPTRFTQTLKTLGCDIVLKEEKADHIPFTQEEIDRLANQGASLGAECLVCTEKDAVKFPKNCKTHLPIIPVEIIVYPTFGKEHLEKKLKEVL